MRAFARTAMADCKPAKSACGVVASFNQEYNRRSSQLKFSDHVSFRRKHIADLMNPKWVISRPRGTGPQDRRDPGLFPSAAQEPSIDFTTITDLDRLRKDTTDISKRLLNCTEAQ